jgi:hypothetical protein
MMIAFDEQVNPFIVIHDQGTKKPVWGFMHFARISKRLQG